MAETQTTPAGKDPLRFYDFRIVSGGVAAYRKGRYCGFLASGDRWSLCAGYERFAFDVRAAYARWYDKSRAARDWRETQAREREREQAQFEARARQEAERRARDKAARRQRDGRRPTPAAVAS